MTPLWTKNVSEEALLAGPAEWISPLTDSAAVRKIAAADGAKVGILDSDHWFVRELRNHAAFGREWVWKSFCRGYNPILMEHLPPLSAVLEDLPFAPDDPGYVASRQALGQTRRFAERINLALMTPRNELTSTGYCLGNPGAECLIYQSKSGDAFSVELKAGRYHYEWFDPVKGAAAGNGRVDSPGGAEQFKALLEGDAVLYLKSINKADP
jgi:hypothetical protein